jgi:hypothetical protein
MKIFTVFLFLFFSFSISDASLIITEVQTRGESPENSYVKIFNSSSQPINVSGFKIKKRSSTGKEYSLKTIPKNTFVSSKSYLVWANSRNGFNLLISADIHSTATISSSNSVALYSKEGIIIDSLAWGEGEYQFSMGSVFPENPQKGEVIKRHFLEDEYQNKKDNSLDFYICPERKTKDNLETNKSLIETKKYENFPFKTLILVSIILSIIIYIIKKNVWS